jgi:hypothetical protein
MFGTEIPLSLDSLIVAIALAGWLPKPHILPLAVLFGLFDGVASAAGPALGVQIPAASLLAPLFLVVWGGAIALNLPWKPLRAVWAYALPPLLALDNLVVPTNSALTAGLVSGASAALGFAVGLLLSRVGGPRLLAPRWIGVSTIIAGGLLLAA